MYIITTLLGDFAAVIKFMMLMRKRELCSSVWYAKIGSMRNVLEREESLIRMTLKDLSVKPVWGKMNG